MPPFFLYRYVLYDTLPVFPLLLKVHMLYSCTSIKLLLAGKGAWWQKVEKDGAGLHAVVLCPHYQSWVKVALWTLMKNTSLWSIEPVWHSWSSRIVQNEYNFHPAGTLHRLKQTLPRIWKDFSFDLTQVCERLRSSSCMCTLTAKFIRNQSS